MKTTVFVAGEFEAAHQLDNYDGPCRNLHGHSYKVQVGYSGDIGPDGMVVDMSVVRSLLEAVLSTLDHTYLNTHPRLDHTTAEAIAHYIWGELESALPADLEVVRVWETAKGWVEVCRTL